MPWKRITYDDIEWVEDPEVEGTGYGTIARLEGENGLDYECRLYPSPGMGNDWLAWSILLNGKPIFTSDPDFTSVRKAVEDCAFKCDVGSECPDSDDGWN